MCQAKKIQTVNMYTFSDAEREGEREREKLNPQKKFQDQLGFEP